VCPPRTLPSGWTNDGRALVHKTYLHLDERQQRVQAQRLGDFVQTTLDTEGATNSNGARILAILGDSRSGQYWDRNSQDGDPLVATEGDFRRLLQALVRARSESPEGSLSTLFDSVDGQIRDNRAPESSPSAAEVAQLLRWVADLLERGWSA
jgi:hypothetical protein